MGSYPTLPAAPTRPTARPLADRVRSWLKTVRRWLKPPRRLRITRGGGVFIVGAFLIGFAAINTGDNLLYLLLGGMMGFIAVSGWMSEQVVRGIRVRVRPPRGVTAGDPVRIEYEAENPKRWLPSYALELVEREDGSRAFVASLRPGETASARMERVFPRRGVYGLDDLTLSTSFPFGLFVKERDVRVRGEVVVWPRTDRAVRPPGSAGKRAIRRGPVAGGAAGSRGEYRGLREYRPGDDPRDVHWRSSARLGQPLVREYERDDAATTWICLDLASEPGPAAEVAVELAASLAARASERNERYALHTSEAMVPPGEGRGQLDRVLTTLARAEFRPDAPGVLPPAEPQRCVLVTCGRGDGGYGDVIRPDER